MTKIGDRIAYIRLNAGLTQDQFADKTGLKKSNISGLENNKYEPSASTLIKIVESFDVTSDWLLFGDKTKEKQTDKSMITKVVVEHQDLITLFKNPKKAKEFNEFLISVEEHNPEGYDNLYGMAKTLYKTTPNGQKKEARKTPTKKQANGD